MPPQVPPGPGPSKGPVVVQSQDGVQEAKSGELEKKPSKDQKEEPKPPAPHRATAKEASQKKAEMAMTSSTQKIVLNEKLRAKDGKSALSNTKANASESGNVWQTVKGTIGFAADAAKAGAKAIGDTTANAAAAHAAHLAEKANQYVQAGLSEARRITNDPDRKATELADEVDRVGLGYEKNAAYRAAAKIGDQNFTPPFKPNFDESERMIKKINAFRREASPTTVQASGLYSKEKALERMLGPYGYSPSLQGQYTQTEILDTALHNWRVSSPEIRRALHDGDRSVLLSNDYRKNWQTPADTLYADRAKEDQQIVSGSVNGIEYYSTKQGNIPDPGMVQAQADKNYWDAYWNLANSMGGGVAEGGKSEAPGESIGRTEAPYRGAPPEPIPAAETQPGPARTSSPPPSEPVNPGGGAPGGPRDTIIAHPPPIPANKTIVDPPRMDTAADGLAGRPPRRTNTEADGLAGRPPQPAEPQNNPALANTAEAPAQSRAEAGGLSRRQAERQAEREAELIAAERAQYAGYRTQLRPTPGAVQEVSVDFALAEMAKGNRNVSVHWSSEFHRMQWELARGESPVDQQIPIVFRVGDGYKLDFERLSPAEQQRYIELDREMNPADYPERGQ
jgi:hypothetical protein